MSTSDIGDIRNIDKDLCLTRFSVSKVFEAKTIWNGHYGCYHKSDQEVRNCSMDLQVSISITSGTDKYDWHKRVRSSISFKGNSVNGKYDFSRSRSFTVPLNLSVQSKGL